LNYKGVLFIGLMITAKGPTILEYNVRFGDPETQSLLPLIDSDFGDLVQAMADGNLCDYRLELSTKSSLGVVIAAPGYPGEYPKDLPIASLPGPKNGSFRLFHAGTSLKQGNPVTNGGR